MRECGECAAGGPETFQYPPTLVDSAIPRSSVRDELMWHWPRFRSHMKATTVKSEFTNLMAAAEHDQHPGCDQLGIDLGRSFFDNLAIAICKAGSRSGMD
jgi:hypothetical protein